MAPLASHTTQVHMSPGTLPQPHPSSWPFPPALSLLSHPCPTPSLRQMGGASYC